MPLFCLLLVHSAEMGLFSLRDAGVTSGVCKMSFRLLHEAVHACFSLVGEFFKWKGMPACLI